MNLKLTNNTLSEKRFGRYLKRCNNNYGNALKYYEFNSQMAQSCHIALEGFEVLLRNKIHYILTQHYGTAEWYNKWLSSDEYSDFHKTIIDTKEKLKNRKEGVNPDKMVAEFTLGFWVRMFNSAYEITLWKPLRNVFYELPKQEKKRKLISEKLNKARQFRNRISHYEPIAWDINAMYNNYRNLLLVIAWINSDFSEWTKNRSDFETHLFEKSEILKRSGINQMEISS